MVLGREKHFRPALRPKLRELSEIQIFSLRKLVCGYLPFHFLPLWKQPSASLPVFGLWVPSAFPASRTLFAEWMDCSILRQNENPPRSAGHCLNGLVELRGLQVEERFLPLPTQSPEFSIDASLFHTETFRTYSGPCHFSLSELSSFSAYYLYNSSFS